ncbi:unnamed protein product [Toxocara canis]|uniref:Uncharacterized protein n=1 Tax=Toxocara canis TaxID=6265 RepID=A0A183UF08_TOXCA|nr:unnamed protein product [Toxocara canis]
MAFWSTYRTGTRLRNSSPSRNYKQGASDESTHVARRGAECKRNEGTGRSHRCAKERRCRLARLHSAGRRLHTAKQPL